MRREVMSIVIVVAVGLLILPSMGCSKEESTEFNVVSLSPILV